MKYTFIKLVIFIGMIFFVTSCATPDRLVRTQHSDQAAPTTKNSNPENIKSVVDRVVLKKAHKLSTYRGLGKSLLAIGSPAVNELTQGLDTVSPEDKGYIAIALAVFGKKASTAIPKLIETFPSEPKVETGIQLDRLLVTKQEFDALDKYGKGILIVQSGGCIKKNGSLICSGSETSLNSDASNWDPGKFGPKDTTYYIYTTPAASALYRITGFFAGHDQAKWQEWLKTQTSK